MNQKQMNILLEQDQYLGLFDWPAGSNDSEHGSVTGQGSAGHRTPSSTLPCICITQNRQTNKQTAIYAHTLTLLPFGRGGPHLHLECQADLRDPEASAMDLELTLGFDQRHKESRAEQRWGQPISRHHSLWNSGRDIHPWKLEIEEEEEGACRRRGREFD